MVRKAHIWKWWLVVYFAINSTRDWLILILTGHFCIFTLSSKICTLKHIYTPLLAVVYCKINSDQHPFLFSMISCSVMCSVTCNVHVVKCIIINLFWITVYKTLLMVNYWYLWMWKMKATWMVCFLILYPKMIQVVFYEMLIWRRYIVLVVCDKSCGLPASLQSAEELWNKLMKNIFSPLNVQSVVLWAWFRVKVKLSLKIIELYFLKVLYLLDSSKNYKYYY